MTPIGVERMGDQADALADPAVLRLENLDTDLLALIDPTTASRPARRGIAARFARAFDT